MTITDSCLKNSPFQTWFFIILIGCGLLNSCVTNKKTTYIQEYKKSEYTGEYVPPETYLIQPNDNLYIRVSTPDPTISSLFNVMPEGGAITSGGESSSLMSYPVQLDSTIEIPYVGSIAVAGKTIKEAKEAIEAVLIDYVADAAITVKLVNNFVTVLGEVNSPGIYPIYKERLNIYQALALAGDMGVYSDRYRLKVIRQTLDGSIVKEFDLTDKNIIDSEFYYIYPNDVIYAKPMKGKFFAVSHFNFGSILGAIAATISLFILIQNYFILQQQ